MEVILSYLLFIRNTTYSRCLKIFFYWILPSLELVVNFTDPSTIHFDYHGHHHHHVNQPARFYTRHKCFFYSHRLINSHTRQLFYYLQIIQLGKVSQKNQVHTSAYLPHLSTVCSLATSYSVPSFLLLYSYKVCPPSFPVPICLQY